MPVWLPGWLHHQVTLNYSSQPDFNCARPDIATDMCAGVKYDRIPGIDAPRDHAVDGEPGDLNISIDSAAHADDEFGRLSIWRADIASDFSVYPQPSRKDDIACHDSSRGDYAISDPLADLRGQAGPVVFPISIPCASGVGRKHRIR